MECNNATLAWSCRRTGNIRTTSPANAQRSIGIKRRTRRALRSEGNSMPIAWRSKTNITLFFEDDNGIVELFGKKVSTHSLESMVGLWKCCEGSEYERRFGLARRAQLVGLIGTSIRIAQTFHRRARHGEFYEQTDQTIQIDLPHHRNCSMWRAPRFECWDHSIEELIPRRLESCFSLVMQIGHRVAIAHVDPRTLPHVMLRHLSRKGVRPHTFVPSRSLLLSFVTKELDSQCAIPFPLCRSNGDGNNQFGFFPPQEVRNFAIVGDFTRSFDALHVKRGKIGFEDILLFSRNVHKSFRTDCCPSTWDLVNGRFPCALEYCC